MIKKRRKSRIYKNKERNKPYSSIRLLNYKILHYNESLLKPKREIEIEILLLGLKEEGGYRKMKLDDFLWDSALLVLEN